MKAATNYQSGSHPILELLFLTLQQVDDPSRVFAVPWQHIHYSGMPS